MPGINWREEARLTGLPVFPVAIRWDPARHKWTKTPLTKRGIWAASTDVDRFDWSAANGFGIRTGDGLYALDLDDYKPGCAAMEWITANGVPTATRTHETISGGRHLLLRTAPPWTDLRSRQHVVAGLDTRGHGGFVAFGTGYTLIDDAEPAWLPEAACEALDAGGAGGEVELLPYTPPDEAAVRLRLKLALGFAHRALTFVWAGERPRAPDPSFSGFDIACAFHLALAGLNHDEIVWTLLNEFRFGTAHRDGINTTTIRAARRCASKAIAYNEARQAALREEFVRHDPEAVEAYLRTLA